MCHWHHTSQQAVLTELQSNVEEGLNASQVERLLAQHGPNVLAASSGRSKLKIVWEQLRSALVALLVVAAIVSLFLAEYVDAVAIITIVLLNTSLGFYQDYRAEKALAALKRFDVPIVKVLREARWRELSADQLVPGDIVQLEAGNLVPADGRLLKAFNLRVQEATLTGESADIAKQTDVLSTNNLPLGDRTNMVYKGTLITYGHATAVVTATGMLTELGKIAKSLQVVSQEATPLQQRLGHLGRTLAVVSLAIVAMVFGLGILLEEEPRLMLMTSLSLAVAIVPEGLPAVATVALAIGARRMFEHHALIRRLPAVETLGSVTVICTDKTGTLTENRMTVDVLEVEGQQIDFMSLDFKGIDSPASELPRKAIQLLLTSASLCNHATIQTNDGGDGFEVVGEPTEAALVSAAARIGLLQSELMKRFPLEQELSFDSTRKRMTTIHSIKPQAITALPAIAPLPEAEGVAFMKGATSSVLETCETIWLRGTMQPLDELQRAAIIKTHDELASQGKRLLAVAFRPLSAMPNAEELPSLEQQMTFLGLVGIVDPARLEATEAVARCRSAGIRPIMITGDHPLTALNIAQQTGIAEQTGINGNHDGFSAGHLSEYSDQQLQDRTRRVSLYARVSPADKLRLVESFQATGEIVAMTGDGVNDAPALKKAHVGVAMGVVGADVAKESADIVLLDDNFATIVNAIEQGRLVYDNIRKFVQYTMTSNAGEVFVMVAGPLFGMPLPLLPLQILWINLVTDGLPGLALAFEPAERSAMQRPPRAPTEPVVDRAMWLDIVWVGIFMGGVSLAAGYWLGPLATGDQGRWRTVIFTVLTLSQMGNVLAIRSSQDSLWRIGLFSNVPLLAAVTLTFVLQLAVIYAPPLQAVFKTVPLTPAELATCLLLSTLLFFAIEAKKFVKSIWPLPSSSDSKAESS